MDKMLWKKFGFKMANKILEAVQEDLVPHTETSWDDTAVGLVKSALAALEAKFVVQKQAIA
jgi:hypothetical protein